MYVLLKPKKKGVKFSGIVRLAVSSQFLYQLYYVRENCYISEEFNKYKLTTHSQTYRTII